jgi:hypothetical protein
MDLTEMGCDDGWNLLRIWSKFDEVLLNRRTMLRESEYADVGPMYSENRAETMGVPCYNLTLHNSVCQKHIRIPVS